MTLKVQRNMFLNGIFKYTNSFSSLIFCLLILLESDPVDDILDVVELLRKIVDPAKKKPS
jgi:hypothetical protein